MISFNINIKLCISVLITVFLAFVIINHFFKGFFRVNPFYRNKILLEGFDASGNAVATDVSGNQVTAPVVDASGNAVATDASGNKVTTADASVTATAPAPVTSPASVTAHTTAPTASAPATALTASTPATATAPVTEISDTEKSTIMAELFEKVNNHMDIIRTFKLSDKFVPINIDKTASDPFVILMNLKLLINNGIYKNELDLKELYDKYIGNKAIQVLASDINSINMSSNSLSNVGSLESSFLTRCKNIIVAHQSILDQIIENKSKE